MIAPVMDMVVVYAAVRKQITASLTTTVSVSRVYPDNRWRMLKAQTVEIKMSAAALVQSQSDSDLL